MDGLVHPTTRANSIRNEPPISDGSRKVSANKRNALCSEKADRVLWQKKKTCGIQKRDIGSVCGGQHKGRLAMRLFFFSAVILIFALGVFSEVYAVPPCSQINDSFCNLGNCTGKTIEWQGSCSNNPPDREWRCKWTGCPGTQWSPWTPCCDGSPGVEHCDCLLAGTAITLADGSTKRVEEIAVGDLLLSFDQVSKTMKPGRVVSTHAPFETDHYYIINGNIRLTGAHPVLTGGRWVEADQLKIGDGLTNARGKTQLVVSIEEVNDSAPTYNFKVSSGTYVAGGIVVHNKENCEHFQQYPN